MGLTWHGGSRGVHQLLTAPGCPGPLLCRSGLPCPALTPVPMPMPCSALHYLCPILPCPVLQSFPLFAPCSAHHYLCPAMSASAMACPTLPCPALPQSFPLCACALFRLSLCLPLPCPAKGQDMTGQDMTAYACSALRYCWPCPANTALLCLAHLKMLGLYHDSSCLQKPCLCKPGSFWLSVTGLCSLATLSARLLEKPTT